MGANFLLNDVLSYINTDVFLEHHHTIFFEKIDRQYIRSYDDDIRDKSKNYIGVIGEFFEREILINYNFIKNKELLAVNLINYSSIKINSNKIIFVDELVDSCGMASHVESYKLIWNAFKEFVERQSFISNYLSKAKAVTINISGSKELEEYDAYLKNFVDEVKYFEISLSESLYVVISIGTGKYHKGVGLGASLNICDAIKKSQKEILQYLSVSRTKYDDKIIIDAKKHNDLTKDLYHRRFDDISIEDLKGHYSYLLSYDMEKTICQYRDNKDKKLKDILVEVNRKYKMEPYIVMIPSFRDIPNLKIGKVFDFNWFPNMSPSTYNKDHYDFVSGVLNTELDRNTTMLPFG